MYTKQELQNLGITQLKDVSRKLGIKGYSKYKKSNKEELEKLILQNNKVPKQNNKVPLVPLPKVNIVLPTPIKKMKHVKYIFKDSDLMSKLNITITQNIEKEKQDTKPITPDILLKMIEEDNFIEKIYVTLIKLYRQKIIKYNILVKKTTEAIYQDETEKNKMIGAIESNELDKLFPMIITNTSIVIKLENIIKIAKNKVRDFQKDKQGSIKKIRGKLLDAVKNEENGIISISGSTRENIRNKLCRQIYILSKGWRPFMNSFMNMVFTGPSGVGKTKLALSIAYIYQKSGILLKDNIVIVSPKDLVASYVGQTAPKTVGVLMKGLEGVIFIDEAYQIMPCNEGKIVDTKSFGPEAITEIVNFLDKFVGMNITIVAGYEREIDGCFFGANEGLHRRFPSRVKLARYETVDLLNIFINVANKRLGREIFNEDISKYIFTLFTNLNDFDEEIFRNQAGDIVNMVGMFLNVYYGTVQQTWENFVDQVTIINETINDFLRTKGYTITIE